MNGAALVLALAVHVRAAGSCPAAADVEAQLAPLLAPEAVGAPADVGVVSEAGDGALAISLLGSDGRTRFSRELAPAASCAEQAEIVAVTLAAWESEIHPAVALRLEHLAAPAPAPPPVQTLTAPPPPAPAPRRLNVTLGAGALGSVGPDLAAGARLEAGLGSEGRRLRWQLSASAVGQHQQAVGPGQATWWRLYVAAGPEYALLRAGRWQAAAGAGALVGLLTTAGTGFPVNRQAHSADAGAELRIRLAARWGQVVPWLDVAAIGWIRRQTVAVEGTRESALDLPRIEPTVAAGADFFVWP